MKYLAQNRRKSVATLVLISAIALVLGGTMMQPAAYAICTGGCCQANCDVDCCTGRVMCGTCPSLYCESCECSGEGLASCEC